MNDTSVRYEFLDWLRVIAILVLFFFHTGMLFVGWGFHIQNTEIIEGLQLPMDISHRLRMPLLFVIAGAGLWYASRRRTAGQVLKERTLRLLLPLLFGMLVIVPPQVYVERLFRDQWEGGYLQFYVERVLQFQPRRFQLASSVVHRLFVRLCALAAAACDMGPSNSDDA